MHSVLILLGAVLLALLLLLLTRKRPGLRPTLVKVLAVALFLLALSRLFLSDRYLYVINGGWLEGVYYETQDIPGLVLRWGLSLGAVVLPVAAFLDSRFFRNLAIYVVLPLAVASACFYDDFMAYFLAPNPHAYALTPLLRHLLFSAELILSVLVPLLLCISHKHAFRVSSLREWMTFLLATPAAALATMPVYAPQVLFGYNLLKPDRFGVFHLLWILITLLLTLSLYYLFRFRSHKERYCLLLFLALALFYHYHSLYLMGVTLKRLPLQLCNIAAYFYLFSVIFRKKRFFHFCFLANVVGAMIAILLPDFSFGDIGFWNMHFLIEHTYVLMVPALGMGLRIFPRLTPKSFIPYFLGFTAYFLSVFVIGTVLNGYEDVTGETVNYFYLFDLEMAFSYFPFITFMGDYFFTVGPFVVYPLLTVAVYLGFTALVFLFYLAVRLLYRLEDDHLALRLAGIELRERIFKRPSRRPKSFID